MSKNRLKGSESTCWTTALSDEPFFSDCEFSPLAAWRAMNADVHELDTLGGEELASTIRLNLRVVELERTVKALERKVGKLLLFAASRTEQLPREEGLSARSLARIIEFTGELFPCGQVTVEIEEDPDTPEVQYVVFCATATGDPRSIVEKRIRWHEMLADSVPSGLQRFRLLIDHQ